MTEKDGFRYCDRCGVLLTKDNNKCGYEICDKCNEWLESQEKKEQMDTPICYCGTVMEIEKKRYSGGMGECYDDWILSCPKCGIKKTYPADNFYGRDFISDEKTVIDTWNDMRREYR